MKILGVSGLDGSVSWRPRWRDGWTADTLLPSTVKQSIALQQQAPFSEMLTMDVAFVEIDLIETELLDLLTSVESLARLDESFEFSIWTSKTISRSTVTPDF